MTVDDAAYAASRAEAEENTRAPVGKFADRDDAWRRRWNIQVATADALQWAIPSHWG